MGLLDSTGAKVVEYAYNAWGKPLYTSGSMASTLGVLNPFRYRGYIYDDHVRYTFEIAGSSILKEKNTYTLTVCQAGVHETESSYIFTLGNYAK